MYNLTLKATAVGSLPHKSAQDAIDLIFERFKEIPFLPQLAGVDKKEDMTVQYIQGIPGIVYDEANCKYFYDTQNEEFFEKLEEFFIDYEAIVSDKDFTNLDKYAITKPYSSAIDLYLKNLKDGNYDFAKCQIIGPFTWATSLCDNENVCAFYDDTYREVLIKGLTLKAIWQIVQIKKTNSNIVPIVFLDEPVMSQLGTSAFMTVKREDVVASVSEIADIIKDFGAICAVHCCGKADWSIIIDSGVDVINFDAFSYTKSLGTHVEEVSSFIKNGGYIAWGIVPTLDKSALEKTTVDDLEQKFDCALQDLIKKSQGVLSKDLILQQSFFTPSCGAGGLNIELAEKAMTLVNELSDNLRRKYEVD